MVLPFDHAATFELKGIPGNIVQDVINISTDGTFVAVGISYGFEEDRARPAAVRPPTPTEPDGFLPGNVKLSQIPVAALIEGFRLNPKFERLIFADTDTAINVRGGLRERTFSTVRIPNSFVDNIIERLKPPEEISFLFSILDSATGRELQDEPIHNLASLGSSNGNRPFRMLAQPLTFRPRSTVRLQIIERSENVQGTLFIVLYGYKTFGSGTLAQPVLQPPVGADSGRVIPFDYVATFPLSGIPGKQVDAEVPINVEGGFVTTSIGYGLAVDNLDVSVTNPVANLGNLTLKDFPTSALQAGIRIRPNFLRVALNGDSPQTLIDATLVDRIFERLNRPEDVSFRYSIFDSGTGRELQNQPINNIAGLGIANGERPFKKLARPMVFLPRSTIRLTVEERFGRGNLFFVFQGYKRLDGPISNPSWRGR